MIPSDEIRDLAHELIASVKPLEARRRASIALTAVAALLVVVASLCVPAFAPAGGLLVAIAGAFVLANVRLMRRERLAAIVSGARNELAQGHLGRAERLVDWALAADGTRLVSRALGSLRAEIALARGDLDRALRGFDAALDLPARPLDARDAAWQPMIRAERALARALSGDDAGALEDAAAIRALVEARAFGPRIVATVGWVKRLLARAALAEIVVASRAGDLARLDALVEGSRRVVLDGVPPRERTLLRAIERMARARATSVYRELASPPKDEVEASPAEWVERVLPGASRFVDGRAPSSARAAPSARARALAPRRSDESPRRFGAGSRLALLWALVGGVVFAYQQAEAPRSLGDASWGRAYIAGAIASAVILVGIFMSSRGSRPRLRAANDAMVLAATDPSGAALASLDARDLLIVAVKGVALAQIAFERAGFAVALLHADVAAEAVEKMGDGADLVELRGMVHAARATTLAALGRGDEARAAIGAIPMTFTARAAATVAVELLVALAKGCAEDARAEAAHVSDCMPLDTRCELLVDLLRATDPAGGTGLAESARLRAELADPAARGFVLAVAPALLSAVEFDERIEPAPLRRVSSADDDRDAAAEREAEAEAETVAGTEALERAAASRPLDATG